MNIVVLGASGQLGQCLAKVAGDRELRGVHFPTEQEADILDQEKLSRLFAELKPDYVVNCAAYTAVDKAEDEPELAGKINRVGAERVASCCEAVGATLVHISTDFVFRGNVPQLLNEEDETDPINVYGLTKLEGERAIATVLSRHYILRTSWLYSEYGNNFVKTMLRLAKERNSLGVIADQVGSPTYAMDLAGCILDLAQRDPRAYGVYHYSNEGVTSWYDFAKAVFELAEVEIEVHPLKTSDYKTRAIRPAFSVMDKSRIKSLMKSEIPYWRDSLTVCIRKLLAPPVAT